MTVKRNQNAIRQQLLNDGTVRANYNTQESAFQHKSKEESRAAAIAARRAEIQVQVQKKENK